MPDFIQKEIEEFEKTFSHREIRYTRTGSYVALEPTDIEILKTFLQVSLSRAYTQGAKDFAERVRGEGWPIKKKDDTAWRDGYNHATRLSDSCIERELKKLE